MLEMESKQPRDASRVQCPRRATDKNVPVSQPTATLLALHHRREFRGEPWQRGQPNRWEEFELLQHKDNYCVETELARAPGMHVFLARRTNQSRRRLATVGGRV